MKLAIHDTKDSFSQRWMAYCDEKQISYKVVNCYANDIIQQVTDCDALLWHHQQGNPKDILFAKALLFSLEQSGKKVFPDFNTNWHFDDKVGQKYLLEALGIKEFVPSWVFYSKHEALQWAQQTTFPKVFKLRGGAGSQNVKLARTVGDAVQLIHCAFGKGFAPYDAVGSLKERWRKYRLGKVTLKEVLKGVVRLVIPPPYARIMGKERGYIYFQEFIPNNDSDIRIIVIDEKAFAIKRMVRENDFRASGSGFIRYGKKEFSEAWVRLSFMLAKRLRTQCVAFDFVLEKDGNPLLVEINYGFAPAGYDACPGYWDKHLTWHEGEFNPYGWMVEMMVQISVTKN
jgi:glutathione synthase/RimK-type ligase-like ATP-grasp enzyme